MNDPLVRPTTERLLPRRARKSVALAVLVTAAFASACSGSSNASDTGAMRSAPTTTAPVTTAPPAAQTAPGGGPVAAATSAPEAISVLYSLTATEGSLTPVADKPGDYLLELRGTDRHTVWFADRPKRSSGTLPTGDLITQWTALGMAEVPPNVALVVHDAADHADTLVVVLRDPRFDAATARFTATITVLADENAASGSIGEHFSALADDMIPHAFSAVSMFIDDMAATVADGCLVLPSSTCPPR